MVVFCCGGIMGGGKKTMAKKFRELQGDFFSLASIHGNPSYPPKLPPLRNKALLRVY